MPKMKDLGINVIPETMRPPECLPNTACGCTRITNPCLHCTHIVTFCVTHTTITLCFTGTQCTVHSAIFTPTVCPGITAICTGGTEPTIITITPTTPQINPVTPQFQGGGLTHESIALLKEQLHEQIALLDEHAKTIGPKTADEIDAREKQLKAELADLASRRSDLKKSK